MTDRGPLQRSMRCGACQRAFPNFGGLGNHVRNSPACTPEKRFWGFVDKSAGPSACWPYTGFRKWDGYGWVARRGKWMTASRHAWILTNGDPGAEHVLHRCDNPPCCNPAHLFLGTAKDNNADKIAKRRHAFGTRGKRNKLTLEIVKQLRAEYRPPAAGRPSNVGDLARRLGVRYNTVAFAIQGRTWRHDCPSPILYPDRVRPERKVKEPA